MESFTLNIPEQDRFTDEELLRFCEANKELRIERDEFGQLVIMPPVASFFSNINFLLNAYFGAWAISHPELGVGFESSAGFTLPDKSMRSPDAAWIRKVRWDNLTLEQKQSFAPICPDFVIELRSKSDSLPQLKSKMQKWMLNGCELGWLIDAIEKKAFVYSKSNDKPEEFSFDSKLTGGKLLPGFELDLGKLK
jgi:Uma2 family endonuclease